MHAQLGGVKIENGIAVDQLPAVGVVAAHRVDLLPGIFRHFRYLPEHGLAALGQVPAADIQAGHQQVAAGGGLGQVDDLAHMAGVHPFPGQQQAGLGQAAAALVHGDCGHVRTRFHGGHRHAVAEVEMGSMGFIRQAHHPGFMRQLHDGAQVAAHTVIGWVVHQHGHRVRVLPDGFPHLVHAHAQGDAQLPVHVRIDVHRHGAAQHQRVDDAPVHVPGQDDLVSPLAGGQYHALHRAGGSAHHQEGVGRAEGVRRQDFRLPDHRYGVAQVIQRFHAVHVHTHAFFPEESCQFRIPFAMLVSRHVKGHHPHFAEALQRLIDRRPGLVVQVLSHTPPQTKNASCNHTTCVIIHIQSGPGYRPLRHTGIRSRRPGHGIEVRNGISVVLGIQSLYSNTYFYYSY